MDATRTPPVRPLVEEDRIESSRRNKCRGRRDRAPSLFVLAALMLVLQIVVATSSSPIGGGAGPSGRITLAASRGRAFRTAFAIPRGGNVFGTATMNDDDDEEEGEGEDEEEQTGESANDIRQHPEYDKLQAYRMKQQVLLQLRATYLSETLAKRGLPLPTIQDVATPEGTTPPQKVDWDCALSTETDPGHCLISYEPEPGSKLVVPMELAHTDKWITLAALNRLRRNDPSKVEPMWNDKYAVLSSWFSPNSRYSLLQHTGPKGVLLSTLLDGNRLPMVVGILAMFVTIQILPIIEALVNRLLVSGFLWERWPSWHRYVHVGLPFKLLIVQVAFGQVAKAFSALVVLIKDKLVDLECQILEETIPLTVGVETGPCDQEEETESTAEEDSDDEEFDGESSDDEDE
eukprot:CAMPEP_0172364662 /NCGR_PEP_ID=MMETSP1060-20121228/7732_1 /TAXON_ID=37318 /ORGANISM="Pseudo-nitzschia pungens, Strain cf. cingulata" /LENGTH=403 /DNA_ID=CAMNT_0013087715 /DNA_START=208 /DNA_END=1419 /DNA_ORIENTATION=+